MALFDECREWCVPYCLTSPTLLEMAISQQLHGVTESLRCYSIVAMRLPAQSGSHHSPGNRSQNTARLSRFPGTA